jgi:4-amino-4-deoxy-L-arabinose transferase-like glycosyltransferase
MCYTATLWLLLGALAAGQIWRFAGCGLVLGVTMLVKPSVALVFPAIYLLLLFWSNEHRSTWTRLTRNFALIAVTAAVVMSPWVVRNYAVSGKFVPTMTQGGLAMFQGLELVKQANTTKDTKDILEDADRQQLQIGDEMGLRMKPDFFPQFYDIHDEIAYYNELRHRSWETYKASPVLFLRAITHNSWAFWLQGRTEKATMINSLFMLPFLGLVIAGGLMLVRHNRQAWIIGIAVIGFILPHLVIIAVARYCSAVIPLVSIPAAVAVTAAASLTVTRPTAWTEHA